MPFPIQPGQTIWGIPSEHSYHRRIGQPLVPVPGTIESIGRKYFYVKFQDNPYPSKFEKADFSPTDSTYKNYMLFPTEDDADLYLQLKQDWTELRRLTSSFTTQFQFTPDNIRKLHEFVEFLQDLMTEKDNRD